MKEIGLYIHIPFCHAKCGYCDFATFAGLDHKIEPYLAALKKEISLHERHILSTIFVGGGTPSVLQPAQINDFMNQVHRHFDTRELIEATFEANPESTTDEVLSAYRTSGFNRISFGLQTSDNQLLKELDRLHSFEQFVLAYHRAREAGFDNINIDLIYGLPRQTLAAWEKTLDSVIRLDPQHISAYALKIESGTKFANQRVAADDDLEADMYLLASEKLQKAGYRHYEISNFAKAGFESQHNLKYWRNEETLGAGLSAASFLNGQRTKNTKVFQTYFDRLDAGQLPIDDIVHLAEAQREKEDLMLALRLDDGVDASEITQLNVPLFEQFLSQNYAQIQSGRYRLNSQGWLLSNLLFQNLI